MYCLLARNIIALWCLKVSGKGLTLNTADCYSDKLINCWGCSDEPRWSRPVPNPLNLTVNTVREADITDFPAAEAAIFFGSDVMKLTINGELHDVAEQSMLQLLESLSIDPRKVAVERNMEILPKREYAVTTLADGDSIEIVHFVGGG